MASLTFAIGDIHGCLGKLERLIAACEAHADGRAARWVFLGDYVDRGPDSRGVIELLMRRQQEQPGAVVCLRGNHEQMAIMAHADPRAMPLWLANSGASTQRNYPETNGRIADAHLAWSLLLLGRAGVDLGQWPHLVAYRDRIQARPQVKAAIDIEMALRKTVAA